MEYDLYSLGSPAVGFCLELGSTGAIQTFGTGWVWCPESGIWSWRLFGSPARSGALDPDPTACSRQELGWYPWILHSPTGSTHRFPLPAPRDTFRTSPKIYMDFSCNFPGFSRTFSGFSLGLKICFFTIFFYDEKIDFWAGNHGISSETTWEAVGTAPPSEGWVPVGPMNPHLSRS